MHHLDRASRIHRDPFYVIIVHLELDDQGINLRVLNPFRSAFVNLILPGLDIVCLGFLTVDWTEMTSFICVIMRISPYPILKIRVI